MCDQATQTDLSMVNILYTTTITPVDPQATQLVASMPSTEANAINTDTSATSDSVPEGASPILESQVFHQENHNKASSVLDSLVEDVERQ